MTNPLSYRSHPSRLLRWLDRHGMPLVLAAMLAVMGAAAYDAPWRDAPATVAAVPMLAA